MLCPSSVPTIARNIPISPTITPRRAVFGALSHFNDRMNAAAATMYATWMNHVSIDSIAFMGSPVGRARRAGT